MPSKRKIKFIWFVLQTTLYLKCSLNFKCKIMENSKELSPGESLDIISEAIGRTKENIKGQSFYYIMWGWIITIASFSHYILTSFTDFKLHYLPWLILIPLGWIFSITYGIKSEKVRPYESYFDSFLKYLWVVLGVSFIIAVFISVSLRINPTALVLLLAGIGTLVSGLTLKFKPLSIGGVFLFAFAIASLFVDQSIILLINTIAVIVGYLIPAYLLKNSTTNV